MYPGLASPVVTYGIAAVALALAALLALGAGAAARRAGRSAAASRRLGSVVAVGAAAWLLLLAALAGSGLLSRWELRPPPFLLALLAIAAVVVGLARSRLGALLAETLPLSWLVGVQVFRVPLELVMHQAAHEGVMPPQMTFGNGWNFDIVSGLSAGVVALLLAAGRGGTRLVAAWNALGLLLLAVIVGIAVATTPMFHAFGTERLNTWVAYVPFVWLPGVMVAAALFGHLLVLRRLRAIRQGTATLA